MCPDDWLAWPEDGDYDDGLGDFLSPAFGSADDSLRELIEVYGTEFLNNIIVDFADVADKEGLRAMRFANVVDAVLFLHDIGVLTFADVIVYGDGTFGVRIGQSP